MPVLDPVVNFGKVTVSIGYDDNDTSIVLKSGDGDVLPAPLSAGPFNVTWWNATDYPDPSDDPNVEIVRITARSTDTITVIRAQEGTTASTKNVADKVYLMALSATKKTIDDIDTELTSIRSLAEGAVSDTSYDATSWNGVIDVAPSKNAVRDKIEAMSTNINADTVDTFHASITPTANTVAVLDTNALPPYANGWYPAVGTWAYASADTPTFTITVPSGAANYYSAGMRVKLTQTTTKYFIITVVTDTSLTVYGGTDYTLANEAIVTPQFSCHKAPVGFPLSPEKWSVRVTDNSNRSQSSPVAGTWYNIGTTYSQITVPIGAWNISYSLKSAYSQRAAAAGCDIYLTLSTTNNSETLTDMTTRFWSSSALGVLSPMYARKHIVLTSKTLYYLLAKTAQTSMGSINFWNGDDGDLVLEATSSYL